VVIDPAHLYPSDAPKIPIALAAWLNFAPPVTSVLHFDSALLMTSNIFSHARLRACRAAWCWALWFCLTCTASAQTPFNLAAAPDTLFVTVNNVAIAQEYSLRGFTANFHYPVLSMISVVDDSSKIVTGLADTLRWLGSQEQAEIGLPVSQIWPACSSIIATIRSFRRTPISINKRRACPSPKCASGSNFPRARCW